MSKMVTIEDIDSTIRDLTGEHPEARRPFLCEGSPIGSEVFLVGINTDEPTGDLMDIINNN